MLRRNEPNPAVRVTPTAMSQMTAVKPAPNIDHSMTDRAIDGSGRRRIVTRHTS